MSLTRRYFLKGLSAAGVATLAPADWGTRFPLGEEAEVTSVNETVSTDAHILTLVPIEYVVIEDGFWSPKREVWRTVTLRDSFRKFEEDRGGAINNFDRVRDGLEGNHAGPPWYDGLIYEMIRGAADFLRSNPDPALESQVDGYVARIVAAAAKDPGGYINTYTQLEEPDHRWGLNGGLEVWQHEFYNLGALVDAGVYYYRATRKTALLEAGVRVANTMAELVGPPPKLNLVPAHELPEEAMLGLYELLTEQPNLRAKLDVPAERYLALAEFWIENRGHSSGKPDWEPNRAQAEDVVRKFDYSQGRPTWGAYAQDDKPVFEQTEVVGHAVRATLFCSAIAAGARLNGRDEYRQAAFRLWENMTFRRMHVTGGVGAYANEEKFGEDYALPNDAYLETCAAVGAGFFHQNMIRTFGHARYADELERTLYNGVLCGVSVKGDTYTYENPLEADEHRARWSWHGCPCCPPMFLKIMGAMPGYIYATDADSVYVNLFVGSHAAMKVKGIDLTVKQTTEYPWEGKVSISVEPSAETSFGLMIRIPGWCRGASMKVNGQKVSAGERVRGYVRVERAWRKGDVVELDLPMPVEAVQAHPKVTANIGRVALMRGPLVYCFESIDQPEVLALAHKGDFTTERWIDRLGGVVAIQAGSVGEIAWDGGLYSSTSAKSGATRRVTAIPFYANANRGPAKLSVWVPRET